MGRFRHSAAILDLKVMYLAGSDSSLSNLIRKAGDLLGFSSPRKPPPLDGEIVYCKNNVCVHPPASLNPDVEHFPGYLNIRSQDDEVLGSTLILTWIPNSTLKKNPRSIEASPAHQGESLKVSPRRSPRQEFSKVSSFGDGDGSEVQASENIKDLSLCRNGSSIGSSSDDGESAEKEIFMKLSSAKSSTTLIKQNDKRNSSSVTSIELEGDHLVVVQEDLEESPFEPEKNGKAETLAEPFESNVQTLQVVEMTINSGYEKAESNESSLTSGPDSPDHSFMVIPGDAIHLDLPELNSIKSAKEQLCGVFSVDLGKMRSLRIFYGDASCTSGQMVIASRESQYKILHFHNGGLNHLYETLCDWKFLSQPPSKAVDSHQCKNFSVIRPCLRDDERHPDEGTCQRVDLETWNRHMDESGSIQDHFHLTKAIFFDGLDSSLRPEMWPFLLHYYPYSSTIEEREQIRNDKYIEYQKLRKIRESMTESDAEIFQRNVASVVENDVVRTDRSNPYFKGENNPNVEILKQILLNYAVAFPQCGYTQGMSDLLSPVLAEIQHEADAYWCFIGLMQRTIFVSSPKDIDIDLQLLYLRELLRLMLPDIFAHLQKIDPHLELIFVHRWILLCFKREFPEDEALSMWEACWAHYQTDYFHLFICVAIIAVYGDDVIQQNLPSDETLHHFNSLSMHMSGDVVLRKARGLLHKFRVLPSLPCTVHGLCVLCEPGMWDSGHVPKTYCVHKDGESCTISSNMP